MIAAPVTLDQIADRRPGAFPTLSRREWRVLLAVPAAGEIKHSDVRPAARMDTSTCAFMLRRLRDKGLIAATCRRRGVGSGSGAPATFYTRTPLGCAVLAACPDIDTERRA